jgi:NAD(P)-dependent dehydrogenase (short-subunit alcohol dehydrogenase family)
MGLDAGGGPMSRVAVVTGAASGVGRSIAEHLARAGHRVAVLDLDGDAAGAAAADLAAGGTSAIACEVDVADRVAINAAYQRVRAELGPIEILVTSAAVSGFTRFMDITAAEWQRTLDVNLTGTFHCIQAAIGDMVAGGWGRIVTISSAAGQTASPRQAHYSASKGGVIAMTKTLAAEFGRKGITANTVPPFTVDTPLLRGAQLAGNLPPTEVITRMIPAGRLGTVDDIGACCAFLCSEAAGYITGQVIAPNGGAVI